MIWFDPEDWGDGRVGCYGIAPVIYAVWWSLGENRLLREAQMG